ncbi:MAG: M14 family metallopeptidase [Phascolarctobacterium sp.]|nr:M14 family metallopeptidase [Phascolarctobacterium sp.]
MKKVKIYENRALYRDDFRIEGYTFGKGKKSVCIVGNMRGNEYQQIYTCSQIVKALKMAEKNGHLDPNQKILVIPSLNPYSMNIEKRFWPTDDTDINRMYPGYDQGETTQRIAAGIFNAIKDYEYGIQFCSNYLNGRFVPNISVMNTGYEDIEHAKLFGLPYVEYRRTKPYDTATLNYNWQIWACKAFSFYTASNGNIDKESSVQAVEAVIRFLSKIGILNYKVAPGYESQVIDTKDLITVRTRAAGIFEPAVDAGDTVYEGQVLARILNPLNGEVLSEAKASCDGIIFYMYDGQLIYDKTSAFKIIPM